MFPPFDTELAKQHCFSLMQKLDTEQCIDFEAKRKNPKLSTKSLFENSVGQMFGVLVCEDEYKNQVVLKAFSGQFNSVWNVKGWVPPLLNTSDFNKLTKESDKAIHELTDKIENQTLQKDEIVKLKQLRKSLSQNSMKEIFELYTFYNFERKRFKFKDVLFEDVLPPTGCGECCAPKLLSYAFKHKLTPISLAEFYYGNENPSQSKKHKEFYSPCDEKCSIILPAILGLEILYRDEDIVVINKQSGLLSIPGRGTKKTDSVTTRLKKLFPHCIDQPSVHRLDMDTSGLLVLAFNAEAHKKLSIQFMNGLVQKKYYAVLEHPVKPGFGVTVEHSFSEQKPISGKIELKFRLDVENRPHQIYDEVYGKLGITNWKFLSLEETKTALQSFRISKQAEKQIIKNRLPCVEFSPITGRTHQLRVHSASVHGFCSPIVGDNLYNQVFIEGKSPINTRLLLHSFYLSFTHPTTGIQLEFWS